MNQALKQKSQKALRFEVNKKVGSAEDVLEAPRRFKPKDKLFQQFRVKVNEVADNEDFPVSSLMTDEYLVEMFLNTVNGIVQDVINEQNYTHLANQS